MDLRAEDSVTGRSVTRLHRQIGHLSVKAGNSSDCKRQVAHGADLARPCVHIENPQSLTRSGIYAIVRRHTEKWSHSGKDGKRGAIDALSFRFSTACTCWRRESNSHVIDGLCCEFGASNR